MASKSFYAVVAGVGSGTGRSVALRFAQSYPVVLLARKPESYSDIASEINKQGGQAFGITADTSDPQSVTAAFEAIKKKLPDKKLAAAIYNVGAGFAIKPFLEVNVSDLDASLNSNVRGLFNFAQSTLPLLLSSATTHTPVYPPTLIITGATASIRGSARFGTFAAGKFAVRGLGQSLAREFGPQGVHVAHVIIDGVIDTPRTKAWEVNGGVEGGKLDPDAIAESYWHLHTQPRSSFTQELDLRPYVEKF
ncbi:NAD(P)-binding protein [Trichocladium antarcticum]|uniref:NAD(P)-binding protein n=1 Tax=Trichocladium antarcticum TaxID=1450529 RepID=A0AAN6UHG3_9PEZI|nr:NAD(P)-binding protein [Trichocladium antarcticum]